MSTETKERDLQEIGRNAYASIQGMVAALECDYERLAELREERADLVSEGADPTNVVRGEAVEALKAWDEENGEELAELTKAAGECSSREEAEERIREDALSVEVRSGWTTLGRDFEAEEFNILLCTGGPAVRIMGELRNGEPHRAWIEVQDWFKPWTEYTGSYGESDVSETLLAYARCFYFGE